MFASFQGDEVNSEGIPQYSKRFEVHITRLSITDIICSLGYIFSSSPIVTPQWIGAVSYDRQSRTTMAILHNISDKDELGPGKLKTLFSSLNSQVVHPMIIPVLLQEWQSVWNTMDYINYLSETQSLEKQTGQSPWLKDAGEEDPNPFDLDFQDVVGQLNRCSVDVQLSTNNGQQILAQLNNMRTAILELEEADSSDTEPSLHKASTSLIRQIDYLIISRQSSLTDFSMLHQRLQIQLSVVYNFIAQRDNKLNVKIAKNSIAVALESKRDSSSMMTIAVLTMVFLPATFVSVS